jgi:protein-S-isoprenylcysteine O-methyltransferase Ste14
VAASALALCLFYVALVFGLRTIIQRRTAGSSGWVRRFGSTRAERGANTLYLGSCGLDMLGPTLVLAGALHPVTELESTVARAAGFGAFLFAIPAAMLAQRTMGSAWRTGIDPDNRSALVTAGPFALVRNPVYTTMLATSLGVALLVPTVLAGVALLGCVAAVEVQTRLVEEPFLEHTHGLRYRDYTARVGRFLPGVGRRL